MPIPIEREIFNNAPIMEAIIDISFPDLKGLTIKQLEALHTSFESNYPNKKTLRMLQHTFEFDGNEHKFRDENIERGFQFWSADNKELITCRLDGFSFNKLKPYSKWEDCIQKTIDAWSIYQNLVKPEGIIRLGVRNINVIEIPGSDFNMDEYFNFYPRLPDNIDRPIEHFQERIIIGYNELDAKAVVTLALQDTPSNTTSIVFDIDAVKTFSSITKLTNETISTLLGELNFKIKDDIFMKSITPKTMDLFK